VDRGGDLGGAGVRQLVGTLSDLYQVDLVLSGHDHSYERFRAQTSTGLASPNGMVEFVVGTGGVSNYGFLLPRPNSLVRRSPAFGVLQLTLGKGAYAWRFVSVPGISFFRDSGTGRCR